MASTREAARPAYMSRRERGERQTAAGTAVRYVGALALLAMAVIHLEQYAGSSYSKIPTIGTLFLLNFVGGTIVSLALMSPLDRLANGRGHRLWVLLALAGAAMAAVAIAFLLISESTALFGFRESGYRPAIVLALISEGVAAVCLGAFAAVAARRSG
jgi:hypothetical protein